MNHSDRIISFLEEINKTPRKSGNRGPITAYLRGWAEKRGYEVKQDKTDNLLIRVPPTPGYEKAPIIVLQGHSDMVCEKVPESNHDFTKDAVKLVREGDWIKGDGTTIGADNGIAIALAMELVSSEDAEHPPIEILITSDEEIGLVGANALEDGFVEGKVLINLDSEEEGIFTIGCAGGADSDFTVPVNSAAPGSAQFYTLTLGGLKGGHSGMDIALNHGNALKMIERVLSSLSTQKGFSLASINGGSGATNAICRDADAVFAADGDIRPLIAEWASLLKGECGTVEEDFFLTVIEASAPGKVLNADSAQRVLRTIRLTPHGVEKMSSDIEGLVETSSNLAWAEISADKARLQTSQRSAVMSELKDMNERMIAVAELAGGSCFTLNKYPSWKPNPSSALLERCTRIYKECCGKEAVVEAIHAGLECGLIGDKYPGMDMISMGPSMEAVHTPGERLYVPSLEPFRDFLVALLKSFK
ncbi:MULTISPECIES: beta-Ala-His dipeptidase [unclassified Oceanispirochaeta]|uniref:beta-Ala-His dipeptidase n=1 Tax=unclassified Oceanispirochaeta TaxID=2635722 RepID=UPI000E093DF2|nr:MULTISPECIES: beta-Ala-His dipeptidase [unclassified Oceanispirochaeta]MBF9017018.1 beta-Ala-His dipeptidase [Oceanispirochaeta sp. M2]NPD73467.1 beta-Ala-His dipeptidase [Oceanispirochaeta sp. M1]RDG30760.1 aminoacyl-histidine dipeptidase [Oceanispirochaeta sp. M1]